jgi:hypothetical protein
VKLFLSNKLGIAAVLPMQDNIVSSHLLQLCRSSSSSSTSRQSLQQPLTIAAAAAACIAAHFA